MITYRIMTEADILPAMKMWETIPEVRLHANGEDSPEGIASFMKRNDRLSIAAYDNDEMAGTILCGHDGRRGMLYHLAVRTDLRRKGIGKELLRRGLDGLKACGITKCALFVLKENESGQRFYEAMDWTEETIVKTYSKIL